VISDYTMPGMQGDRLAAEIRNRRADMPIILCTGRGDKIGELKALGVDLVLPKPIVGKELIDAVTTVVG
jgi:CheY-like chemotaxis protein